MTDRNPWPELSWQDWGPTAQTLHRYLQVIGKIQLALSPRLPEWQQASLRVTGTGIGSQTMVVGDRAMTITADLIGHQVRFALSDGGRQMRPLDGCTVAEFWRDSLGILERLGISVTLNPKQQELPDPLSCDTDTAQRTYDPDAVSAFYRASVLVHNALQFHREGFWGKQTQVSFWWGGFDQSVVRFSGRAVDPPGNSNLIYRVAMDEEQHEVGFWPGDDASPEPVFYAFTYPMPAGIEAAAVSPSAAAWSEHKSEFLLPYDAVRASSDPAAAIRDFARSTYEAGAMLGNWDRATLERV
jgi:Family of unknown function (DUF5996)